MYLTKICKIFKYVFVGQWFVNENLSRPMGSTIFKMYLSFVVFDRFSIYNNAPSQFVT